MSEIWTKMSIKIAAGMIIFNGNYVLKECLESIYPFVSQILIAEGPVEYWQSQGYTTSTDGTNDILHEFYDPDKKITIHHGQYSEKNEQCNAYVQYLNQDNDYIWNLDCDEIFKSNDVETIIRLLDEEKFTSVGFKSLSFYGGFDDYLTGFEEGAEFLRIRKIYPGSRWLTHRPPTIIHNQRDTLPEKHLDFNILADNLDIRMYHYSYVFPDQVKQKIAYYKAAVSKENCIDDYFNQIYLPWVTGNIQQKHEVEQRYNGVHEFVTSYRGSCFTSKFTGEHPSIIIKNYDKLLEKFNQQLNEYK